MNSVNHRIRKREERRARRLLLAKHDRIGYRVLIFAFFATGGSSTTAVAVIADPITPGMVAALGVVWFIVAVSAAVFAVALDRTPREGQ